MFLCDAFFNRKLNLSHLPKTNTQYAHIKSGVKRTYDALDDLRRKGGRKLEGAYLVGNSGKLGQYLKGTTDSVQPRQQLKKTPKTLLSILHNHPNNTSLSAEDLVNSTPVRQVQITPGVFQNIPAQQVVNTTPDGSIFRAYLKREGVSLKTINTKFRRINSAVKDEFSSLKPGKLTQKDLDRRSFIMSHLANRSLANQGLIHYRAKLTPKDQRTLDFWLRQSPKLKSIYDGE